MYKHQFSNAPLYLPWERDDSRFQLPMEQAMTLGWPHHLVAQP